VSAKSKDVTVKRVLFYLLRIVLPESPRWLAVQGRNEEVSKLLHEMCSTNGRELPRDFHPTWLIQVIITEYKKYFRL